MNRRELPPTAGLPLQARELLGRRADPLPRLADLLGTPPLQLECSGTTALWVALRSFARLRPDRHVVVMPAFTCPLVPLAVRAAGLEVCLCDLDAAGLELDRDALRAACGPDTLAVLPTHLAGRVVDVPAAVVIARGAGAFVLEDAAQALGARAAGRSVGLRGDAGVFSLAVGKGLSIFEGGLLLARDAALREVFADTAARELRGSRGWELRRSLELLGYAACYRPALLRWVYGRPLRAALRRNDKLGAVGDRFRTAFPRHAVGHWRRGVLARAAVRLPDFLRATRERALALRERLQRIPGVEIYGDREDTRGVWPSLLVRLPGEAMRDAALALTWAAGLGVSRAFVHALPDYPALAGVVPASAVPNARDFAARTLTIGTSHWLDYTAIRRIYEALAAVCDSRSASTVSSR